jgi:hypothetical protein
VTIIADPPELPDDGGGWEPRFLKLLDKLDLIDAVCLFAPDTVRFENFFCRRAGEVSFGSLVVRGGPDCGHGLRRAVRTVGAQISEP